MEIKQFELPGTLKPVLQKARKTEWITIVYIITVIVVMYAAMGSSQAMKTAWLEDALGLVSPVSFLIASKIYDKKPNAIFPYGYHRVFGIAFLTGALALFGMGAFLLIDSAVNLIKAEHPTIGSIMVFGRQVWLGWLMILALLYSSVPAMILGFKKLPMAKKLHNKILFTDASTQKADYMTAFAAMAGIIGIGAGWWWADSVTAIIISVSVLNDGYSGLKTAVLDLMDRRPAHTQDNKKDELADEAVTIVKSWPWVKDAKARFREHGQVFFGEVFIVVQNGYTPPDTEESLTHIKQHHWKLHDVVLVIVKQLPQY